MPRYDYRCARGHEHEAWEDRETRVVPCRSCGRDAQRQFVSQVGFGGFHLKPTREHYIPLGRAMEAQHEILHQAEVAGVQAPDFWGEARRRVASGEVQAIT